MKYLTIPLIALLLSPSVYADRKTCKDFKTQKEAQAYFIKTGDKRLDRDGDGQACDCLPGGNGTKCPKKK